MSVEAGTESFTVSASAAWTGGLTGEGIVQTADLTFPVTVPTELGGRGVGQTPESLLASAAASCYAVTLDLVLASRGFAVTRMEVEAEARVEKTGRRAAITGLTLRPRVVLADGGAVPPELFERAERACLVSQVIKAGVPLTLTPQ